MRRSRTSSWARRRSFSTNRGRRAVPEVVAHVRLLRPCASASVGVNWHVSNLRVWRNAQPQQFINNLIAHVCHNMTMQARVLLPRKRPTCLDTKHGIYAAVSPRDDRPIVSGYQSLHMTCPNCKHTHAANASLRLDGIDITDLVDCPGICPCL